MKSIIFRIIILLFGVNTFSQVNELKDIETYSSEFYMDMRYATTNNFLEEVLYDCAKCILLPDVAEALNQVNLYFNELGYRIKIFDCYRPLDVQKKMFAKVPNPIYVADPKEGSVHNKGGAVDITLVTLDGKFVDMGTDHDYFGKEAHIDNYNLPEEVLANRKILQDGMKKFGFNTIQSEWWHFNHHKANGQPVKNEPLPCGD